MQEQDGRPAILRDELRARYGCDDLDVLDASRDERPLEFRAAPPIPDQSKGGAACKPPRQLRHDRVQALPLSHVAGVHHADRRRTIPFVRDVFRRRERQELLVDAVGEVRERLLRVARLEVRSESFGHQIHVRGTAHGPGLDAPEHRLHGHLQRCRQHVADGVDEDIAQVEVERRAQHSRQPGRECGAHQATRSGEHQVVRAIADPHRRGPCEGDEGHRLIAHSTRVRRKPDPMNSECPIALKLGRIGTERAVTVRQRRDHVDAGVRGLRTYRSHERSRAERPGREVRAVVKAQEEDSRTRGHHVSLETSRGPANGATSVVVACVGPKTGPQTSATWRRNEGAAANVATAPPEARRRRVPSDTPTSVTRTFGGR